MHDAEEYTISVRREIFEGEVFFVARVAELPDVEEFADTPEFARGLALDTIRTTQQVFTELGQRFPAPNIAHTSSVSGRVTLRLPISVHAHCIDNSKLEGVSLNTYILTCIAAYQYVHATQSDLNMLKNIERKLDILTKRKQVTDHNQELVMSMTKRWHITTKLDSEIDSFDNNGYSQGVDRDDIMRASWLNPGYVC